MTPKCMPEDAALMRASRRRFLVGAGAVGIGAVVPYRAAAQSTPLVYVGADRWLFARWESLTDPGTAATDVTLRLIAQTRDWFASKGIGLFLYVVPMKARYYQAKLPAGVSMAPAVVARYARVMKAVAALDISSVDIDAAIVPVGNVAGQALFYHTDQHWTTWSAEAAGAQIAAALLRGWPELAGGSTPMPLGAWYRYRKMGDLAAICPPALQARLGEETFVSRRFSDYQKQDAKGNYPLPIAPAVHIVGNSLSNPYCGVPEKIANVLSRPVGLTWLYGNVGPWQTMLNYVESGKLATPPKVVVWQMNEPTLINGPSAPGFWDADAQIPVATWNARMRAALGIVPT